MTPASDPRAMSELPPPAATPSPDGASGSSRLGTAESRALLRECFIQYRARMTDMARSSLDMCGDLFEWNTQMPEVRVIHTDLR